MAFYRCPACLGVYQDPQGLARYFHACPPVLNTATGRFGLRADHRNENPVNTSEAHPGEPRPPIAPRVEIPLAEVPPLPPEVLPPPPEPPPR